MGRFFKNIKGQLGRDTGKAISGLVYGDKHATVYRRVNDSTSKKKKQESPEEREERLETTRIKEELFVLQQNTHEKADEIIAENIPLEEKQLSIFMMGLLTKLRTYIWKSNLSEENKITNQLSDTIFHKFNESLFYFLNNYPDNRQIEHFIKQSKSLKTERFIRKNIGVLGVTLFFILVGIIAFFAN